MKKFLKESMHEHLGSTKKKRKLDDGFSVQQELVSRTRTRGGQLKHLVEKEGKKILKQEEAVRQLEAFRRGSGKLARNGNIPKSFEVSWMIVSRNKKVSYHITQ